MGLKELYTSLEDGYYGLLDKLQRFFPIYSLVDPIDRFFPSFVLVLILLLAGIGGGIFWLVNSNAQPTEYNAYIKVMDKDKQPLKDITVSVVMDGVSSEVKTNSRGVAALKIAGPRASATVSIHAQNFLEVNNSEISLNADQTTQIELEPQIVSLNPKYVLSITNSKTGERIRGVSMVISFSCAQTSAAPSEQVDSDGQIVVEPDPSCGNLTANFAPTAQFQGKSVLITESEQEISLDPLNAEPENGTAEITVLDENSNPVSNAAVNYWTSDNPAAVLAASVTDAQGKTRIAQLPVGMYGISATASDGRTKRKENIAIAANEITPVLLQLPLLSSGKKIFIKVQDAIGQSLSGVQVTLYDNTTRLGSATATNAQGILERSVNQTEGSSFSAVFWDPNFLITTAGLTPVDSNQTIPTAISLEKALTDESGVPSNYGIALVETTDEQFAPLPNVSVQLFKTNYSNPLFTTKTGPDANAAIFNLPAVSGGISYVARAFSSELDANGASDARVLNAGETKEFPVVLYTGTGQFKITVVDADNPSIKIAGAQVNAYRWDPISKAKIMLSSGKTGTDGKWLSAPIKTNNTVRFDVFAKGRKIFSSEPFVFSRRNQILDATFWLSPITGFPQDPCTSNNDCSGTQTCNSSNECEQTCSDSVDCAELGGYFCAPSGVCQLAAGNYCDESNPCSRDCQLCVNNQCTEPVGNACSASTECCSLVCDGVENVCINPTGNVCTTDADCGGNGFVCQNAACKKQCTQDADCPASASCGINGFCETVSPTNALKLTFEELRGTDVQDPLNPPLLLPNKTYHAKFRLELSKNTPWTDLELHVRVGPDSDLNATDQNVFITNLVDTLPGASFEYQLFSRTTQPNNVFSTPEEVASTSGQARQVNAKVVQLESQHVYTIAVQFKTKNGLKPGTPIPLFFEARGYNNDTLFATPRHAELFAIGQAVCTTNCPRTVWAYYLNDTGTPVSNPMVPTIIAENSEYQLLYSIFNSSSDQDYSDAELDANSDSPAIDVLSPVGFSGQYLPSQHVFEFGLDHPVLFSTTQTSNGTNGAVNLSLVSTPAISDGSKNQRVLFSVEPHAGIIAQLVTLSPNQLFVTAETISSEGKVPVDGALVKWSLGYGLTGAACNNPSVNNVDWEPAACVTDSIGRCSLSGATLDNSNGSVLVEMTKPGFKTKRACFAVNGGTQVFGEPRSCLQVRFPNNPNANTTLKNYPTLFEVQRPNDGTTDVGLAVQSNCPDTVQVFVQPLGLDAILQGASVTGNLGGLSTLAPGETVDGILQINKESPLGFIPVVLTVNQQGIGLVSKFIAARVFVVDHLNQTMDIVSEGS